MSSLSLINLALAPSNFSASHIEVSRKDSSVLTGRIFSSSVCLIRDTDGLCPDGYHPYLETFCILTHTHVHEIHMTHERLPPGSIPVVQVVRVCPDTADLSDSGLRLSLVRQSRSLEYLLLQSTLGRHHSSHQVSIYLWAKEGIIPAADPCLNSVSTSAYICYIKYRKRVSDGQFKILSNSKLKEKMLFHKTW